MDTRQYSTLAEALRDVPDPRRYGADAARALRLLGALPARL